MYLVLLSNKMINYQRKMNRGVNKMWDPGDVDKRDELQWSGRYGNQSAVR